MSFRLRLVLAIGGLILVCLSLAVLAYVFWPLDTLREQFRPAPTLFAPPQALAAWLATL